MRREESMKWSQLLYPAPTRLTYAHRLNPRPRVVSEGARCEPLNGSHPFSMPADETKSKKEERMMLRLSYFTR